MWKELLKSKHFVLLCSSVAVLCLTLSIFVGISAYQSARAQCVAIPSPSGLVVGGGTLVGSRFSSSCTSWGQATCGGGWTGGTVVCPTGSTLQATGQAPNSSGYQNTYYLCISN